MDNELWVLMFQRLTNIAKYHHEDKWNWSCSTNSDDDIGPQVIYPDTQLEMGRKGWTDRDLEKVVIVMMVVMVMVRMILFFGPAPLNLPFRSWGRWPWWGGDDDDSEDKDHAISGDDEDWYKEAGVGYDGYGEINTEVLDTVILYPCNWINDDSEDEDHDIRWRLIRWRRCWTRWTWTTLWPGREGGIQLRIGRWWLANTMMLMIVMTMKIYAAIDKRLLSKTRLREPAIPSWRHIYKEFLRERTIMNKSDNEDYRGNKRKEKRRLEGIDCLSIFWLVMIMMMID